MFFLKVLGGLVALGIGLWWGTAGRYRQDPREVDRALEREGRSRRTTRHFTPLGWLRRDERASHRRRRTPGRRFDLIDPGEKKGG